LLIKEVQIWAFRSNRDEDWEHNTYNLPVYISIGR